jgi:molecular chaperone DnaK (HSP70)/fido (protein-threonine AMPylation protein)
MDQLVFRNFNEVTSSAIPTVLGFDPTSQQYLIGEGARKLAFQGVPIVQNFKRSLGDPDPLFEGKNADGLLSIRAGIGGTLGKISPKEAVMSFFKVLRTQIGDRLPKQLIVGIPASTEQEWQRNFKSHLTSVFLESGLEEPKFFPEPFAVFQYYRHFEKVIPDVQHVQAVLVVDIGGGTFDCCAIQTTLEGNLARKGSTAVPLGVRSVAVAGKDIDRKLVERALLKVGDPRLKKESLNARLEARPYLLYLAEEAKMRLSEQIENAGCRVEDDCSRITFSKRVAVGMYHPDLSFDFSLTGEDLKRIILDLWSQHWGPALVATVNDIKYQRGQLYIEAVDTVVLAGGSSRLPFVRQLVTKTLAGQTHFNPDHIVLGKHFEKAVAYGLAIEAREQRKTFLRTHNSIGPCIFSPLFLHVSEQRNAPWKPVEAVRLVNGRKIPCQSGALVDGAMELGDFSVDLQVALPFRPQKYFLYRFTDAPLSSEADLIPLNLDKDIVRVPPHWPSKFRLRLDFTGDGIVRPHFVSDKDELPVSDFFFGGLQISKEIDSYAGIDFGTSNSYVVNLWSEPTVVDFEYPTFKVSESAGARLRNLQLSIEGAIKTNVLSPEEVLRLAKKRKTEFIFHSIKIEGSELTRGETEEALAGQVPVTTKEMQEPVNVARAYEFVMDNPGAYRETPEAFIRELNKIVLSKISDKPGQYRSGAVALAGMNFSPPAATAIRPFMEKLGLELKEGAGARSPVHFAAEAHAKLTAIHPFADGNGRTARLLMNAILIDAGLPPVVVEIGDKERYLDSLASSNTGELSSLCMLLEESIRETLDELRPVASPEITAVPHVGIPSLPPATASQRLADAVRRRVSDLNVQREARYKAWAAAFDSFREAFGAATEQFNETFSTTPFVLKQFSFDMLPFDKYMALINGSRASRTWLNGCEIAFEGRRERFVFFFQTLSPQFIMAVRGAGVKLPQRDVTLCVSRWSDGIYERLLDEPIGLREVAYSDGQLLFLLATGARKFQAKIAPMSETIQNFFADIIEAFF